MRMLRTAPEFYPNRSFIHTVGIYARAMGCFPSAIAAPVAAHGAGSGDAAERIVVKRGAAASASGGASVASGGSGGEADPTSYEFRVIYDKYETYDEVAAALRSAGLESSNLVMAVDFTKSNQWTGAKSFNGLCLHELQKSPGGTNPYQRVIEIVGRTLAPFDDDNLIPAFGFGDLTTGDRAVFPFLPSRPCRGFEEVIQRYRVITPQLQLSGPTNFAPAIEATMQIVRETGVRCSTSTNSTSSTNNSDNTSTSNSFSWGKRMN